MSASAIRTAIVTRLNAVPNIGVVQPYERYALKMDQLKALYVADGQLRGWFVRREKIREIGKIQPRSVEYIRWRIQGLMALDDAGETELAFDNLVEAVRDAFRGDDTLSGTVAQCSLPDGSAAGIQLDDAGPVMFAGVLCHGARLALNTVRYL
ncbi:hypothetical protein [Dyella sp. 20L07]|uniref:hypothetical protein n=1 Tax=Dyella sp. 20L07 TaxID=3384240 RepID=UPI003D2A0CF3